ncbi:HyaD/HybD family hydrogenase maturation endopeptidase [Sulfurimonas sp. SAG-AH-194-C20]|nr:HyaD/HybD family hydrogenase maturation endopeptidase [Sulfurimonas sp. SAG-AH-194-C20]MDF1878958.1 HyaD/HybD family hydrogenase maturation endopeptidase [Sulfurimonas sp. SAG-AH-194-C20]
MVIVGIGNVLQKDDGLGVYAATYLHKNYTFSQDIEIINGGVEGIHLLNVLEDNSHVVILDCLQLDDEPASIYAIPAKEISGYGLNNGGAHEIGILQCMDMMELQGKEIPEAIVIGIIPAKVTFEFGLSQEISDAFEGYISVVLQYLKKHGVISTKVSSITPLSDIISTAKDPSGVMIQQ